MQKIGRWILEYDEESYLIEGLHLYWVVTDSDTSISFCIGYNENTTNVGFIIYANNSWNDDIEIIERLTNKDFPNLHILLLSNKFNKEYSYDEKYRQYITFMSEVNIDEVKRLITKEIIDDLL